MEWLNGIFALFGFLIGLGFSEYRSWRERKERFQVITFDKRLQAHQEALSWFYRLHKSLNFYDAFVDKKTDDINKALDEVREWWQTNCLLLDESSRQKMVDSMMAISDHVGFNKSYNAAVYASLREMRAAIIQGIGIKHLPEMPKTKEEKSQ